MEKLIHIIPTPIGNLEDITLRSIKILGELDLLLAEDTRVTKKLLRHYNIKTPMLSYHAFNEHKIVQNIIEKINSGVAIGLVSDAGTPSISDPGFLLIRECIKNNIKIICLPGATASIPALVQSGLPCDRFVFEGFLPVKKGRKKRLLQLMNEKRTSIIYESPHRIIRTLNDFAALFPERHIVVLKELTKMYESSYRGSINEVLDNINKTKIKGEFVIVLSGHE